MNFGQSYKLKSEPVVIHMTEVTQQMIAELGGDGLLDLYAEGHDWRLANPCGYPLSDGSLMMVVPFEHDNMLILIELTSDIIEELS